MNRLFPLITPPYLQWKVPVDEKSVYLTFDDGPVPGITPEVLKILEEYGIKATFFMVGHNIEKHPRIFDMVVNDGHQVANHTYHHLNGWKTPKQEYVEDIRRCRVLVASKLFRPPYGRITHAQARWLKDDYKIIMWSVLSKDYDPRITKEKCLNRTIKKTRPGSIVVFHDNLKARENILYSLPRYIESMLQKDYRFEPLGEDLFK